MQSSFCRALKTECMDLASKKTSLQFRRCSARIARRSQLSLGCYKCHTMVGFTSKRPLRRLFLGSIQSGIRCAPIRLSKNSARKNRTEQPAEKIPEGKQTKTKEQTPPHETFFRTSSRNFRRRMVKGDRKHQSQIEEFPPGDSYRGRPNHLIQVSWIAMGMQAQGQPKTTKQNN